ncbi:hypothetical protein [Fibrella forsythiae]|uniref:Uncharacterized protein n=1 Tax=Fibrella forsythiae TaxID=2817061 RepID=A0ABS3JBN2_9BACT|nr:hypothetical protein [Fibrella forsythiae]MBO0947397.1 hypothetical protein [Fibrella forsythiae]
MYENNPAYQDYPEVTPDANTIEEPNDHKKAVATAVGGSVVLGAAAYGLSLLDDNSGEAAATDDASSVAAAAAADAQAKASLPVLPVVMPVDTELDKLNWPLDRLDELTFDEAFAAARHQMGPAHHFNWHAGLYNTFYQQEEAGLSKAERDAFIATLPGTKESASVDEPEAPSRLAHPSGGVRQHTPPTVAEPQLADSEAEHRTVAAVPAITVVPLAAVAEHDVTPLADAHPPLDPNYPEPMIATQDANSLHHGSIAGSTIDSIDHHNQFEHDSSHSEYDGMDPHHLGE